MKDTMKYLTALSHDLNALLADIESAQGKEFFGGDPERARIRELAEFRRAVKDIKIKFHNGLQELMDAMPHSRH